MNSDEATVVNLSLHQRVLFASRRFPSTADSLAAAERTKTPRGTRRFQNQALGLQLWKPLKIEVFTHQLAFGFGDRAAVVPLQARSDLLRLSPADFCQRRVGLSSGYAPRYCAAIRFAIKMSGLPKPFASGMTPTM